MEVRLEDRVCTFVGLVGTVGIIFLVLRIVFGSNVLFSVIVCVLDAVDAVTVAIVTFLFNTSVDKGKTVHLVR